MNFSTPKFETAVSQFRSLFPGHEQLFRYGQFYVFNRMISDLIGQIETALRSNIRFQYLPAGQLDNAIRFFTTKLNVWPVPLTDVLQMLDAMDVGGDMAPIRAMLGHAPQDSAEVQNLFSSVWSGTEIPSAPLWVGRATLGTALAAHDLEKTKCFDVLRALARKLLRARSIAVLPAPAKIAEGAVAGASVQEVARGAADEVPQQTIRYGAHAGLTPLMKRMKATIDAGGYVHCGLLSGASHEHSVFPQPEHHILVFAHDTINGHNAFLFWDPDAARSNIASTGWGRGLGVLFGTNGRLSTAIDEQDLSAIDRNSKSMTFGNHLADALRHCYQVYYMQSLPV